MEQQNPLEKLKNEILSELGSQKKDKKKLQWSGRLVTVVLVLLTLFSLVQTVQSATILNKIKGGSIKAAGTAAGSSPAAPANVQNLPNMVGGC